MTNISNEAMAINAMLMTDGYKLGHRNMYPAGMNRLYSNFTPRSNKYFPEATDGVVVFGIQYFVQKYLIDNFNQNFFSRPLEEVLETYSTFLDGFVGENVSKKIGTEHIKALHELGYLPIEIKALKEGTMCPIGMPVLTITNTHEDFAWLVNYLESLMSNELWLPMTSATTANCFKKELVRHAEKTGMPIDENLNFLCHDFSMRGMSGVDATITSGMGHLTSFSGSESIPAIVAANYYYGGCNNNYTSEKIHKLAGTVPATEHSIQCSIAMSGDEPDDDAYLTHILNEFPDGIVSIVADGYDYWHFISKIIPKHKDEILNRNGRVVIRPDSGDPVKIICGDEDSNNPIIRQGSYDFLCSIFGCTINDKGYRVLDPHIGLLYGDSITMKRQKSIYALLELKGICASNLILGIGSFTYQNRTRDSLGFAMKATYYEANGVGHPIFKDPKTVVGMPKKSHKGLLFMEYDDMTNTYTLTDNVTVEKEASSKNALKTVFKNGVLEMRYTMDEIRNTLKENIRLV